MVHPGRTGILGCILCVYNFIKTKPVSAYGSSGMCSLNVTIWQAATEIRLRWWTGRNPELHIHPSFPLGTPSRLIHKSDVFMLTSLCVWYHQLLCNWNTSIFPSMCEMCLVTRVLPILDWPAWQNPAHLN